MPSSTSQRRRQAKENPLGGFVKETVRPKVQSIYAHDYTPKTPRGINSVHSPATTVAGAAAQEVMFFPLKPNFPNWQVDIAKPENMYMITNPGASKLTADELYASKSQPVVFFGANVYGELQYLFKHIPSEWAVILMYRKLNDQHPKWLVYDYFFVDQDVASAEVELEQKDFTRYITHLQTEYPAEFADKVHNKLGHLHSHHSMGTFWSGTDTKQQESATQMAFHGDFRIFCVGNNKGELKTTFMLYSPVFWRLDDVATGIYFGEGYTGKLTKERKDELEVRIKALVKKKGYTPTSTTAGNGYVQGSFGRANYGFGHGYNYGGHGYDDDNGYDYLMGRGTKPNLTALPKVAQEYYYNSKRLRTTLSNVDGAVILMEKDEETIGGFTFKKGDGPLTKVNDKEIPEWLREDVAQKIEDELDTILIPGVDDSSEPPMTEEERNDELLSEALFMVETEFFGRLITGCTEMLEDEIKTYTAGIDAQFPEPSKTYKETIEQFLDGQTETSRVEDLEFLNALWKYLHIFFVDKSAVDHMLIVQNFMESVEEIMAGVIYSRPPAENSSIKIADIRDFVKLYGCEKTFADLISRYRFNTAVLHTHSSMYSVQQYKTCLKENASKDNAAKLAQDIPVSQ